MISRRHFLKVGAAFSAVPLALSQAFAKPVRKPFRNESGQLFIPTGITALDEALGGGLPPRFVWISGEYASGKTALLRRIARGGSAGIGDFNGGDLKLSNRPVTLIDNMHEHFAVPQDQRAKIILNLFGVASACAKARSLNKSVVGTSVIVKRPYMDGYYESSMPHAAPFYANVTIRIQKLDYWGRGTITIIKNRCSGFLGDLVI